MRLPSAPISSSSSSSSSKSSSASATLPSTSSSSSNSSSSSGRRQASVLSARVARRRAPRSPRRPAPRSAAGSSAAGLGRGRCLGGGAWAFGRGLLRRLLRRSTGRGGAEPAAGELGVRPAPPCSDSNCGPHARDGQELLHRSVGWAPLRSQSSACSSSISTTRRLLAGLVLADDLDEPAVAGRARVGDDDAVRGLLLLAHPHEADLHGHVDGSSRGGCTSVDQVQSEQASRALRQAARACPGICSRRAALAPSRSSASSAAPS